MAADSSVSLAPPLGSKRTGRVVWDRLWEHRVDDERDDALLTRERRNPRWRSIVRRLKDSFGSLTGLKTIELGSGRGDLSVLLAQRGAEVTLLDASDVALERARERFDRLGLPATYCDDDMLSGLSGQQGRFHVSLSCGVAEHFKSRQRDRVLRAHFDVLRPGGVAIVSVPNAWCPSYRLWKRYLELRGWWPYGMELPYSPPELARRARSVGFDTIETRCTGLWQSIGDHWGKSLLGRGPDWVERRSWLDRWMGGTLLLMAQRGDGITDEKVSPEASQVHA